MIKEDKKWDAGQDLMEFHQMISDRCNGRLRRCSDDYWNPTYGFSRPQFEDVENEETKITIPYDNTESSLRKVRNAGRWLATQPTIIGITNKYISYIIGRGHAYDIKPQRPIFRESNKRNESKIAEAERLTLVLKLILKRLKWRGKQHETVQRIVRDGEVFRRLWRVPNGWDITFMEPEDIKNPADLSEVITPFVELPLPVQMKLNQNPPDFGIHGICRDDQDARVVYGFWHFLGLDARGNRQFEFVQNTERVQHLKNGVDSNDPRGIPIFYWGIPHGQSIIEVDGSMVDIALVQAKHAVIYNYKNSHLSEQIQNIAKGRQDDADKNRGRPLGPGEVDTKGATVEVTQLAKNAEDSVEIIQQEQRFLGNMLDMPEFMSTADAGNTGRSNAISAEGPFDRRTQRDQIDLFEADEEFFAVMLSDEPSYSEEEFKMIPEFPVAATRDKAKEIESEVLLVESELQSEDMARDNLKIDSTRAKVEIAEQTRPSLREQMNANNRSTESRATAGNPGTGNTSRPTQGRRGARGDT